MRTGRGNRKERLRRERKGKSKINREKKRRKVRELNFRGFY